MKNPLLLAVLSLATALSAPAQDWARTRLDKTPRHTEWVKVAHGKREVNAFVTYPEVKAKATAVIVIHENQGLTDWARSVTDQLAEAGYIAIAPDLLSGMAPNGGSTPDFASRDAIGKAFSSLPPDQVTADLKAVLGYVSRLPACNGKVVVGGFCWGGGQTFRFATNEPSIKAALVFYGPAPKDDDLARIACPVFGFYGGNDARINASIPKVTDLMKAAAKSYDPVIYDGAGHGFMRAGETPPPAADAGQKALDDFAANRKARDEGWKRVKAILGRI